MNKHNQNGSLHVIVVGTIVVALLCAVGYAFWSNVLLPRFGERFAGVQGRCTIGTDKKCPITRTGYMQVAKHVYLEKSDTSLESDAEKKQNVAKISDYMDKHYPERDFLLTSDYDSSTESEKRTTYRSFELIDGVRIDASMVPQVTVGTNSVDLDVGDDSTILATSALRQTIARSEFLSEQQIISILNKRLAGLTSEQKDMLYRTGRENTVDDGVEVHYTLIWQDGGKYTISLNSSTMTLDAKTGEVLYEDWNNGVIS